MENLIMTKGFFAGLEEIRQENTQYAVFHINKTPELLTSYLNLKQEHKSNGLNSEIGIKIAIEWAENNKNTFGDLFQTELELVRWNKVLDLL